MLSQLDPNYFLLFPLLLDCAFILFLPAVKTNHPFPPNMLNNYSGENFKQNQLMRKSLKL